MIFTHSENISSLTKNLKILTWKPKEITQKFDVLNQYQTLALTDQTISRKNVATIAKHLMKYVLRTCIYRSIIMVVTVKMHNGQISTIRKSQ